MILKLKKEIYTFFNLEKAIDAFSSYSLITVTEDSLEWTVVFSDCKYDPKLTLCEFENYLIDLENT